MYVTNIKSTKELKTPSGKSVWWLLPREIGTPNFEMRYFEVKKGVEGKEEKHPFEHEVFVVRGEGVIKSEGREVKLNPGMLSLLLQMSYTSFLILMKSLLALYVLSPMGARIILRLKVS